MIMYSPEFREMILNLIEALRAKLASLLCAFCPSQHPGQGKHPCYDICCLPMRGKQKGKVHWTRVGKHSAWATVFSVF